MNERLVPSCLALLQVMLAAAGRCRCAQVGTKEDLRFSDEWIGRLRSEGKAPLTSQEGVRLAQEIGAIKYIECSALTQKGLKSVFDEAIKVGTCAFIMKRQMLLW